jgi:hypothetical protein
MKSYPKTQSPHHFLFMLPGSTTPEDQERVVKSAKALTSMGYVYVASTHEHTMEDRDNIRFMPLRSNDLPRFGEVSGVMVVRDQEVARAAEQAYPRARVFVIDPSGPAPAKTEERVRPSPAAIMVWQPVMNSFGVPEAA